MWGFVSASQIVQGTEKNIQLFCNIRVSKCNIVVFLSFQSSPPLSRSAGHQLAIDGPDYSAARISRILAVFGFSSPILETHQLVYLVL